jgi:hypothetical protein
MNGKARAASAVCTALLTMTLTTAAATTAGAQPRQVLPGALAGHTSQEMSETTRLADRRALVSGERAYAMGDESGLYPATGWHTLGEMGGFWTPPVKLLDGLWLGVDGSWLGKDVPTTAYHRGWGYQRFDYHGGGLDAGRVEFVPTASRAVVVGLTLRSGTSRTVSLAVDAHSELMPAYPWGGSTPSASDDTPDQGAYVNGQLVFTDNGTPPGQAKRDYAAVVAASQAPSGHQLGKDHRGPQDPAVVCPATGDAPYRCDESTFGKGTGGQLTYQVSLKAGQQRTLWFAVGGGDDGVRDAKATVASALHDPEQALRSVLRDRQQVASHTSVDLPGDRLLQQSVEWSKQNLADSVQQARDLRIRPVNAGTAYPPAKGTVAKARWYGAGFPDYPWLFATDGEYTAFAAVSAGQSDVVKDHLRALRDVSEVLNDRSGKVAHEVVSTGDVYFGANTDAGNTDETVKFPSIVALVWRWTGDNSFRDEMYDFATRNLHYVYDHLDADGDGWPEGLANVERPGMGSEKLDSTVYLDRGLRDLADLATGKGDHATAKWATGKADDLEKRFDAQWWYGGDAKAYADSIDDVEDPANDNTKIFQRHWIGVTPMEVELAKPDGSTSPLSTAEHGSTALDQRETPCYTGDLGLDHTGTGPTSDPKGNPGPSCDSVVSTVASDREIFSLNSSIMAVAEGNYGRLGADQQGRYTTGNARIQLDPSVWELPGGMPEIAPSPDFEPNIDHSFTTRSMALQAWGTYGVLWPVVHQQLGVAPDLGRGKVLLVPQVPAGQQRVAGKDIVLGKGSVDVSASHAGNVWRTDVRSAGLHASVVAGAVLPAGAHVAKVTVNGHAVSFKAVPTSRGLEIRVPVRGKASVVITTR